MKRTLVALVVTLLSATGAGVAVAGNGAQKSGLMPSAPCGPSGGGGTEAANGFVVLNAPGKPGAAHKLVGEVALKNAASGASYAVEVVPAGTGRLTPALGTCGISVGTLVVNEQGNGNLSFQRGDLGSGHYYVTLRWQPPSDAEQLAAQLGEPPFFASAPVELR